HRGDRPAARRPRVVPGARTAGAAGASGRAAGPHHQGARAGQAGRCAAQRVRRHLHRREQRRQGRPGQPAEGHPRRPAPPLRAACVGHVEWLEFVRVDHLPRAGEIVHASEGWEEPGGGGAMAAVQLARLAGDASFFTALGDDVLGHRAHDELERFGLRVRAAWRHEPQRRAFTYLDAAAERTITVLGDRLVPTGADDLPWDELEGADAVYVTGADAAALRLARRAQVLTATPR